MMELIRQGGPVMWGIFACSIFAAWVFFRRVLELHRNQIKAGDFLRGVFNVVSRGNLAEAVTICDETPGPIARMMKTALLHRSEGRERVECALRDVAVIEVPRLERLIQALHTAGHVASGLGLLGTLLGLMQLAQAISGSEDGLLSAASLEQGLWRALVCAAAGLAVSIPAYAGGQFLGSRVESIVMDMERAAIEIRLFLARLEQGEEA